MKPVSSIVRRLTKPSRTIPTIVMTTEVTPTAMVATRDALTPRPLDSRMVGA